MTAVQTAAEAAEIDSMLVPHKAKAKAAKGAPAGAAEQAVKDRIFCRDEDEDPQPMRPDIEITPEEAEVTRKVIAALAARVGRQALYCRAGCLVSVIKAGESDEEKQKFPSGYFLKELREPDVRREITLAARVGNYVYKKDGSRTFVQDNPPGWLSQQVACERVWQGIKPLVGVVSTPVLRPDGTVISKPGYDPATALFYVPDRKFPPIPERPTQEDARAAVLKLIDVIEEFPFNDKVSPTVWVAYVLTLLARPSMDVSPGFLFNARAPGTGKGRLVAAAHNIVFGRNLGGRSDPGKYDEWRKYLDALVFDGQQIAFIDNIKTGSSLGNPHLDSLLTMEHWQGRLLGKSSIPKVTRNLITFVASGNNISVVHETKRRILLCDLWAQEDNPHERACFKYPDLIGHCRRHRDELLVAALTILTAYVAAGRPKQKVKMIGSFEEWTSLVASAVVFAGLPDPGRQLYASSAECDEDPVTAVRSDLISGIEAVLRDKKLASITTAELAKVLQTDLVSSTKKYAKLHDLIDKDEKPAQKLAYLLRANKGTYIMGKCIDSQGKKDNAQLWGVRLAKSNRTEDAGPS